MSCEIAGTFGPFLGRVGGYGAKGVGITSKDFGATLARIDDRVALATVKIAPFRSHKRARHAFLYSYAQHWIPSRVILVVMQYHPRQNNLIVYRQY